MQHPGYSEGDRPPGALPAEEGGVVSVCETVTEQDLRDSEDAYRAAAGQADELRDARNRVVRSALSGGWTLAQVSRATGLTRGRVGQISTAGREQR